MKRYVALLVYISLFVVPMTAMMKTEANECTEETLASKEFRVKLRTQFLWGNIGAKGKPRPTKEDYLPVCLRGKQYTITGRQGGGEGVVYSVVDDAERKEYALKVYEEGKTYLQEKDELAIHKLREARKYVSAPIVINKEQGYTLYYPLLDMPYKLRPDVLKLRSFEEELKKALMKDGLGIGDDHEGNYMYDKNDRLWRIDLGALYEL